MSHPPGRTLLVGCGKLGTRLGQRLVDAGGEVYALRRNTAVLPETFSALSVDLKEPVRRQLPDVDAMVITLPPGRSPNPGQPDGYLTALKHLAAALPSVPQRVVFVSSTGVFDNNTKGQMITEDDTPTPTSPRGRRLREAELLASSLFNAHIVRPAGIYGPGRDVLVRKVLESTPTDYPKRTNRIHETDLVRALAAMVAAQDPPGVVHAVDQDPAPLGEIVTFIAHRLGLPPPPDIQPAVASGKVLSGALLLTLVSGLKFPSFKAGYDDILATRSEETSAKK